MESLYPTPLFFQVPQDVLHNALTDEFCELAPDFLCFERFYQAVALNWPHEYTIVDLGGYMGVQGWLFSDFAGYICVDRHSLEHRCELPPNGMHVCSTIQDQLASIVVQSVDLDDFLFICSAVPDKSAQELALQMPNHVVWYPGERMQASGLFAGATIDFFYHLKTKKWNERADKLVWDHIKATM